MEAESQGWRKVCILLGFHVNSHPKESDLIICTSVSSKILCHMISVRTGGTVWAVGGGNTHPAEWAAHSATRQWLCTSNSSSRTEWLEGQGHNAIEALCCGRISPVTSIYHLSIYHLCVCVCLITCQWLSPLSLVKNRVVSYGRDTQAVA